MSIEFHSGNPKLSLGLSEKTIEKQKNDRKVEKTTGRAWLFNHLNKKNKVRTRDEEGSTSRSRWCLRHSPTHKKHLWMMPLEWMKSTPSSICRKSLQQRSSSRQSSPWSMRCLSVFSQYSIWCPRRQKRRADKIDDTPAQQTESHRLCHDTGGGWGGCAALSRHPAARAIGFSSKDERHTRLNYNTVIVPDSSGTRSCQCTSISVASEFVDQVSTLKRRLISQPIR